MALILYPDGTSKEVHSAALYVNSLLPLVLLECMNDSVGKFCMDKWTRQGEEGQNLGRSPRLKRPLSPFARLRPLLAT